MEKRKGLTNKKARFEYSILEEFEAGMELLGSEVKIIRLGRGSLSEAHVRILGGQAYLVNANFPSYEYSRIEDYDPKRSRRLLLKKKEIEYLDQKTRGEKLVLIPIRIVLKRNRYKLLVGLARSKKQYEKREDIKRRDIEREVARDNKLRLG
jgi:SsrA-binding protein